MRAAPRIALAGAIVGFLETFSIWFVPEEPYPTFIVVAGTLNGALVALLIGAFVDARTSLPRSLALGAVVGVALSAVVYLAKGGWVSGDAPFAILAGAIGGLVLGPVVRLLHGRAREGATTPETHRIARQMQQAFEGGAWHGPAVLEILEVVDAATAAARPVAGAHSIWELVLHLSGTQTVLLRRIGGDATELTPEEDWPPIAEATDAAWRATLEAFRQCEAELRRAVLAFPELRLDRPLVEGGTSAYNNFHGHVQHLLYHAAQMGLLEKALHEGGRPS